MLIFLYWAWILIGPPLFVVFAVIGLRSRQWWQGLCAVLWLAPLAYEVWVQYHCTGECNIRVDIVLLWPLEILILSMLSGFSWWTYRRRAENQCS